MVSTWSPTAKNDMCMNTCWTWYIKSNEPDWNIIVQILDHQDTPKMDRRSPGCTLTMQKTQISYARLCMLKIVPESIFSWIPSWGLEVIPKWTQNRAKKDPKSSQKSSQNRSEGVWTIWTLQKWSSSVGQKRGWSHSLVRWAAESSGDPLSPRIGFVFDTFLRPQTDSNEPKIVPSKLQNLPKNRPKTDLKGNKNRSYL